MSTVAEPKARPARKAAAAKVKIIAPPEPVAVSFRPTADLFKLAADPTRLQVLVLLMDEPRNVTDLCAAMGITSQPAVSHHISLLRAGRLIEPRRDGKFNFYSLTDAGRKLAETAAGFLAGA